MLEYKVVVKDDAITFWVCANLVIYLMNQDLNTNITRPRRVINTNMNFWTELLINMVYVAAVVAVVYVITYTDIVGHLLAS